MHCGILMKQILVFVDFKSKYLELGIRSKEKGQRIFNQHTGILDVGSLASRTSATGSRCR